MKREKKIKILSLGSLCFLSFVLNQVAFAFDETVNHVPHFQVSQKDPQFRDIAPENGGALCWPSSVAHRMIYLKEVHQPQFSKLSLPLKKDHHVDVNAAVRKFVDLCHTSLSKGTSQSQKVACITRYFQENGYKPTVFSIGPASRGVPASPGSQNQLRSVQVADLKEYLKKDFGVILHVGWLKYDPRKKAWIEHGSHSLNAYGYDYNRAWGDDKIILKVTNPMMNYEGRAEHPKFFDDVTVSVLEKKPGVRYPENSLLRLNGPGFNNPKSLPVLEDIYVFSPQ